MKKRIAIILLVVMVLPVLFMLKPIIAEASIFQPNITAAWNKTLKQVSVEWGDISAGKTAESVSYRLYYREEGTDTWTEYMKVDWESTGKGITGLNENQLYEFILKPGVEAAAEQGQKASNIASITTQTFELGFNAKWTGEDVLLNWRNASVNIAEGVWIWCKGPADASSKYIGDQICEARGSILVSSIKSGMGESYAKPQKGETWTFGITDRENNTSQVTVKCWTEEETDPVTGDYNAESTVEAANHDQFWDPDKDTGNIFERIVALLVYLPVKVINTVGAMADFKSIDKLVFLNGVTDEERVSLPWDSSTTKNKIFSWFMWLMWSTFPLYTFVIAYHGFKIMYSASNPAARAESMESIQRWFLSLGIVMLAPVLLNLLMTISGGLTDAVVYAYQNIMAGNVINVTGTGGANIVAGSDAASTVGTMNPLPDYTKISISTGSILGTALVKTMFALLYLYFNVIYIIRMTAMTVMYAFTPILAILWAVKKDTPAMAVWIGELASNAFMPVAHGLVICTILLLTKNQEGSWVQILIMLYCLVPLSEVLRNSLTSIWTRAAGMNESKVAGNLASLAGLGGLLSMGRVGGSILGGRGADLGAAANLGKTTLKPQSIPNLNRSAAKPPRSASSTGFMSNARQRFDPQQTAVPNMDFKKMNYAKHNGKSIYARHNWDHKTPKPTAVKNPQMSVAPKKFYYKSPETNRHASEVIRKAIPIAATAAKIMTAPMIAMAGAVPGGARIAAGAYAATAGIARGGATVAGLGHNLYQAKKEAGGNTAQAMQRVTGADTKRGAAWNMAKTTAGSVFKPTATYNNAVQAKNAMDQQKNHQIIARKAKLDARLNPVKFKETTVHAGQSGPSQNTAPPRQPNRTRVVRKNTAPRR